MLLILHEKENYINKLNAELNDLRNENEKLKDKLIVFELENLEKTSLGIHQTRHLKH